MKNIIGSLIVVLTLISQNAHSASDEFKDVTCGSDIPKAIIGKYSPNERVVVTEARHKDIGLEDEGADDVGENDSGSAIYDLLENLWEEIRRAGLKGFDS